MAGGVHRINSSESIIEEVYPSKYWPGDTLGDHLEFALKYDGTNLAILSILFQKIAEEDLLIHVRYKPTGKYARRLWFLYEFLTGNTLTLDDLNQGNYINLLKPDEYYTVAPVRQVRRQRINDNGSTTTCWEVVGSASKTTVGFRHGNARATSISCRMRKSQVWSRLFRPPTEAQTL